MERYHLQHYYQRKDTKASIFLQILSLIFRKLIFELIHKSYILYCPFHVYQIFIFSINIHNMRFFWEISNIRYSQNSLSFLKAGNTFTL